MGKLMGQQSPSYLRSRFESARSEHDVRPARICVGIDRASRQTRMQPGVHTHPGEIAPEAWLKIGPRRRIERPTCRAQHLLHNRRRYYYRILLQRGKMLLRHYLMTLFLPATQGGDREAGGRI